MSLNSVKIICAVFLFAFFTTVVNSIQALDNEGFYEQFLPLEPSETCKPKFCSDFTMTSPDVLSFCNRTNAKINGRCCITGANNDSKIVGIDYTKCNISKLFEITNSLKSESIKFVQIFDIRGNTLLECSREAYAGFLNLTELHFDDKMCACPGLTNSWQTVKSDSCFGLKTICNSNFTSVNCTDYSTCAENGPGNFLCHCKDNYHGYKCLEKGEFPTVVFTLVLCLTTLFLCAFMWHTQRRHVKSS